MKCIHSAAHVMQMLSYVESSSVMWELCCKNILTLCAAAAATAAAEKGENELEKVYGNYIDWAWKSIHRSDMVISFFDYPHLPFAAHSWFVPLLRRQDEFLRVSSSSQYASILHFYGNRWNRWGFRTHVQSMSLPYLFLQTTPHPTSQPPHS